MNQLDTRTGALVAALVAGMFAAGAVAADEKPPGTRAKETSVKVKCGGLNECRGKGECAGPGHACAGHNECRGKGWVTKESEEACKAAGGTVIATRNRRNR